VCLPAQPPAADATGMSSSASSFYILNGNRGKPLSHQSGVLTAFPQRSNKLQIAEVCAVQSPVTLWKRCEDAVQSPRTPCGGVYLEHAQNKGRGLAFAQRVQVQTPH